MSLCKMDKSLKELHRKLEEEQKLREAARPRGGDRGRPV